jgi:DNA-binding transcriptional LysR family regulator
VVPDELQEEELLDAPFVTVVAAAHPLATTRGVLSAEIYVGRAQ